MGQYWTIKNVTKRESLGTHSFGSGLKYLEQWFNGALYTAMMVLLTDLSSLGHGGGDFVMEEAPEELRKFIEPVIGSWAGDSIVFSGDYTEIEEYKDSDEDGEEAFTDISQETALAVWSMVACDMLKSHKSDTDDAKVVKDRILEFLTNHSCVAVRPYNDANVKSILDTIDALMPEEAPPKKMRKINHIGA